MFSKVTCLFINHKISPISFVVLEIMLRDWCKKEYLDSVLRAKPPLCWTFAIDVLPEPINASFKVLEKANIHFSHIDK